MQVIEHTSGSADPRSQRRRYSVRLKMAVLLVSARLSWGDLTAPFNRVAARLRFFPPPVKAVYKEHLINYFFRN